MTEDYNALISNETCELVRLLVNANIFYCISLFKKKCNADASLASYKARLVAN